MNEITRREVLQRMSSAVPALALAEAILSAPGQAIGQQPEVPAPVLANFIKLSVVLTGYEATDLNPRLAQEYFNRIDRHLKSVGHEGDLLKLVTQFGALGTPDGPITPRQEKLIADLMSDTKYQCPVEQPSPLKPLDNPHNSEAIRLINGSYALINGWTKVNPFGCDPAKVAEVVNVNPCPAPDWTMKEVDPFICQEITAVWYMSAIYQVTPGLVNVDPVTGEVTPFDAFHYGSAKGYVSGLIWGTVGGHTHPYAQCGGEFGYWQKNPQPDNA